MRADLERDVDILEVFASEIARGFDPAAHRCTYTMSNMSRDDLELGQDSTDDREVAEYMNALDAAEKAGEGPGSSFVEYMVRCEANCSTLPAPVVGDDELPFLGGNP